MTELLSRPLISSYTASSVSKVRIICGTEGKPSDKRHPASVGGPFHLFFAITVEVTLYFQYKIV